MEIIKQYIVKSLIEGKNIKIKRIGEDINESLTLSELDSIIDICKLPEEKWKINKFIEGKYPSIALKEDEDYSIVITIK